MIRRQRMKRRGRGGGWEGGEEELNKERMMEEIRWDLAVETSG